jgi:hypothetical protein
LRNFYLCRRAPALRLVVVAVAPIGAEGVLGRDDRLPGIDLTKLRFVPKSLKTNSYLSLTDKMSSKNYRKFS